MATRVKEVKDLESGVEEVAAESVVETTDEPTVEPETAVESKSTSAKTQMYLLSALVKDAEVGLAALTALVQAGGLKVEKTEDFGLKKLAFPINKQLELTLVSVFFLSDAPSVRALDSELAHAETIERFLLTTWRAGLDEPKRRQAERQKRELAASLPQEQSRLEPAIETPELEVKTNV